MTNNSSKKTDETSAENAPEEEQNTSSTPDPAAEAPEEAAATEAAPVNLEEEVSKLEDQLLRTMAEMQNLRKRTAKDVQDAHAYSISSFAMDMLGVLDNLQRAEDSVPEQERAEHALLKNIYEGVQLTRNTLEQALSKHGIVAIDPKDQRFNPDEHQAVMQVPGTGIAEGTVVEVMQRGFKIKDRLLRPAMVGVASGAAQTEAKTEAGPKSKAS